jgi:hypothetical protein
MKQTIRKRLADAGWETGDAREFLDLSDAEAEFIEMKLALAADLRARRRVRHLNQTQRRGSSGRANREWRRWKQANRGCLLTSSSVLSWRLGRLDGTSPRLSLVGWLRSRGDGGR